MEAITEATGSCTQCGQSINSSSRFCNHCGALQAGGIEEDAKKRDGWLRLLAIFFGLDFLICAVFNFTKSSHTLSWLLFTDCVLAAITIIFALILWDDIKPLLRWKNCSLFKILYYSAAAITAATIVHYSVKWLNRSIFDLEGYFYFGFSQTTYPRLTMFAVIALQPALMEELGYRGVVQTGLLKILDTKQAVFITAFLFALIHMSFISFFWLLPFALGLSWIRMKENTLWYGVLIHFCFNATVCVLELFELNLF
ncbi:MAG TPA: CPBP family intramembrane glutamic endopeptidase [Puia sp.]|nr:CPBP family intramembrane glutamic endopeptidase [Puia sp.]